MLHNNIIICAFTSGHSASVLLTFLTGSLLPVKLSMWSRVRGLMPLNERVVLTGSWCHGFFSYTTVGALNVGSMRFTFDDVGPYACIALST